MLRLLLRLGLSLGDLVLDLLRFLLGDRLREGDLDSLPVGFRRRGGDRDRDGERLIERDTERDTEREIDRPTGLPFL